MLTTAADLQSSSAKGGVGWWYSLGARRSSKIGLTAGERPGIWGTTRRRGRHHTHQLIWDGKILINHLAAPVTSTTRAASDADCRSAAIETVKVQIKKKQQLCGPRLGDAVGKARVLLWIGRFLVTHIPISSEPKVCRILLFKVCPLILYSVSQRVAFLFCYSLLPK